MQTDLSVGPVEVSSLDAVQEEVSPVDAPLGQVEGKGPQLGDAVTEQGHARRAVCGTALHAVRRTASHVRPKQIPVQQGGHQLNCSGEIKVCKGVEIALIY